MSLTARVEEEDLDDVKPNFDAGRRQEAQVIKGALGQAKALGGVDGGSGTGPGLGGAGLHFDEDEAVLVAEDEIDLAAAGGEVGSQVFEALLFEMPPRGAFTKRAVAEMQRGRRRAAPKGQALEQVHGGTLADSAALSSAASARGDEEGDADDGDHATQDGAEMRTLAFEEAGERNDGDGRGRDDGEDKAGGRGVQGPLITGDADGLAGEGVGHDPRPGDTPFFLWRQGHELRVFNLANNFAAPTKQQKDAGNKETSDEPLIGRGRVIDVFVDGLGDFETFAGQHGAKAVPNGGEDAKAHPGNQGSPRDVEMFAGSEADDDAGQDGQAAKDLQAG